MMLKPRDTAWRTGWRPHDCPASRISPLCGTLLSAERSRTTPNSSHTLFNSCPATHDGEDEFGHVCAFAIWEGDFVPGYISAHLLFKNARVPARVLLQLAFSVFVYAEPKEEPSGVPVSGCVWSGSRLLVLRDPNSALRDSYSKPTHSSIKPWTRSPFLD